jgi:cytidylate kinase
VRLITISSSFGAGGSEIGPELAKRLDVPFLDRAIPAAVAERLAVPLAQALEHDQSVSGVLDRLLRGFAQAGTAYSVYPLAAEDPGDQTYAQATEQVIHEYAADGQAIILGRAAAVVLRDDPRALRVRLDGPSELRIAQAMRLKGIDRETAERRMRETDRAREAYLKHFYHADVHDPGLYHLVIDSTVIALDTCVELIATAALRPSRLDHAEY